MLSRKIAFIGPVLGIAFGVMVSSCDKGENRDQNEKISACGSRFGLDKESMRFSLSGNEYVKSSAYLKMIYDINGIRFNSEKICGSKVAGKNSCFYFFDTSSRLSGGHEVCVHPKTFGLTYYKFET